MPSGQVGEIRFRRTLLERTSPMMGPIVMMFLASVAMSATGDHHGIPPAGTAGVLVAMLVGTLLGRGQGVTLTHHALVVDNVRRRVIPWSGVQGILVDRALGQRTIVVCEAGGRRTRLPAPTGGAFSWDPRFEEKFHTIGRWWLDHRGPGWVPLTPLIAYGSDPGLYTPK
ncbi:hypothetical protein [Peterkaempfera griseoplana]|uniref:hypothetical protein n=1 Tax=Peterkaempfera griseoplana TaxID=66896 RepID=UPI0007C6F3D1|nr:hypothetical protein [Peterkaempfera griseoplana]